MEEIRIELDFIKDKTIYIKENKYVLIKNYNNESKVKLILLLLELPLTFKSFM